jgi:O-antigen ligase
MAPDYLFSGPRLVFDNVVSNEIQETGITTLYETDYGVDPHNFVLSVWKDEGLIVAFIWLMMFIGIIRLIVNKHFSQKTSQSLGVISLLVYPIVHFTLSPPSTDNRLMVAAFVGLSLFLLDRTYRLSSNRNMILSKDALLKI